MSYTLEGPNKKNCNSFARLDLSTGAWKTPEPPCFVVAIYIIPELSHNLDCYYILLSIIDFLKKCVSKKKEKNGLDKPVHLNSPEKIQIEDERELVLNVNHVEIEKRIKLIQKLKEEDDKNQLMMVKNQ